MTHLSEKFGNKSLKAEAELLGEMSRAQGLKLL